MHLVTRNSGVHLCHGSGDSVLRATPQAQYAGHKGGIIASEDTDQVFCDRIGTRGITGLNPYLYVQAGWMFTFEIAVS